MHTHMQKYNINEQQQRHTILGKLLAGGATMIYNTIINFHINRVHNNYVLLSFPLIIN